MAYVSYTGLTTPNTVLAAIREYVHSLGLTIIEDMTDDLDIFTQGTSDGKKLVFKDTSGTYFICMRSANGYQIFPEMYGGNNNYASSQLPTTTDAKYSGIGMTVSEGYSSSVRWFSQYRAPVKYSTTTQVGVAMKLSATTGTFTLYCNHVTTPSETLVFTLYHNDSKVCQHFVISILNKYDAWTGGVLFSGSFNSYSMSKYTDVITNINTGIIPVLSTSELGGNTFLRADIDEAPTRASIYWASSGKNSTTDALQCYTGKQLAMPLRYSEGITGSWRPKIVDYSGLQSRSATDQGMNCNTLNCITINLPLFVCVKVDPDSLSNYSAVGTISGVYLVSLYSMASCSTYEISYPSSGSTHQVFSVSRRRGTYGFDGISITQ